MSNNRTGDQLIIARWATGIVYADRWNTDHGDYVKLAFLPFRSLELEIMDDCPRHLRERIEEHAAECRRIECRLPPLLTGRETMTDRIRTLTVTLDRDMRDDDVEAVKQAIDMVKCVADVTNGPVVGRNAYQARQAFRQDALDLITTFLHLVSFGCLEVNDQQTFERIKRDIKSLGTQF